MYHQHLYDPNRFQDAGPYYFDKNKHITINQYEKLKKNGKTFNNIQIWNDEIVLDKQEWYERVNSIRNNENFISKQINKNSIGYVLHESSFVTFFKEKYTLDLPILEKYDSQEDILYQYTLRHITQYYADDKRGYGKKEIKFFNDTFLTTIKESADIARVFPKYKPMSSMGLKWAWAARRYKMEYSEFGKENDVYKDCFILRCQRLVGAVWCDMCSILSTLTEVKINKEDSFQWHLKNIYENFFKNNDQLTLFETEKSKK